MFRVLGGGEPLNEGPGERLGPEKPVREDLAAGDYINERGDWRPLAMLEGRELRPSAGSRRGWGRRCERTAHC
ncbi:hypothetical protein GCM10027072_47120 [Streptomyces bullii]